jgi:hypothetical protein
MNTKTHTMEVIFRRPFVLGGLEGVQPPGAYQVETYSELLNIQSAVAYRRLSTSIVLHNQPAGICRIVTIDPADLEEALRLDALPEREMAFVGSATTAALQPEPREAPISRWRNDAVEWRSNRVNEAGTGRWQRWIYLNATELWWGALVFGTALTLISLMRW